MIASGGVGTLADLEQLARVAAPNVEGVDRRPSALRAQFTVKQAVAALQSGASPLPGLRTARTSPFTLWAMVLKRVIPCLDVDAGRVVKGTNFVGLRDAGDPVELAERYDAEGADELVFLDITASHEKRETIVELARRTADNVFIPFTIGGGIRSVEDAQAVLDAGADKVSVNPRPWPGPSCSPSSPTHFGAQCVVRRDRRRRRGAAIGWDVYVNGGRKRVEGREAVAWAARRSSAGRGRSC